MRCTNNMEGHINDKCNLIQNYKYLNSFWANWFVITPKTLKSFLKKKSVNSNAGLTKINNDPIYSIISSLFCLSGISPKHILELSERGSKKIRNFSTVVKQQFVRNLEEMKETWFRYINICRLDKNFCKQLKAMIKSLLFSKRWLMGYTLCRL